MPKKTINILYLVLEMEVGGLQRIINQLITGLDKNRFTPCICCLDSGGRFLNEIIAAKIPHFILSRKPSPFDLGVLRQLRKIIKEHNIDIIHSQNGCAMYAALAGATTRTKAVIHTDHGRLIPDRPAAILEDCISSLFMKNVIAVSNELAVYLNEVVRISKRKILTIINGVDAVKFSPLQAAEKLALRLSAGFTGEEKLLGTVCRLDPIKNLGFMIQAMREIIRIIPNCKLIIIGDGPSKEELLRCADDYGVRQHIVFWGASMEVEKILPLLDLYVCTSLSEGTSMTILEAMSCGLPVVASAVGGNVALVDQTNGALFTLDSPEEYIHAVTDMLASPERLHEAGRRSRVKIDNEFAIAEFVKKHAQLYEKLVAAPG